MDVDRKDYIQKLVFELEDILSKNLAKNANDFETIKKMERARAIRKEIESMGFLVLWKAEIYPNTLDANVKITILVPKENLSPEYQEIYDKWFAKTNGFLPPSANQDPPKKEQ